MWLRLPTHGGLLPWEFDVDGRTVRVHVHGRLISNRNEVMVAAALAGQGLAWIPEDLIADYVSIGALRPVLTTFAMAYPGYHAYYTGRNASPAVRSVVYALRPVRRSAAGWTTRRPRETLYCAWRRRHARCRRNSK